VNISIEFDLKNVYNIGLITYQFKTADDFPERDPISWEWFGSNGDSNWFLVCHQDASDKTPNERHTNYPLFNINK